MKSLMVEKARWNKEIQSLNNKSDFQLGLLWGELLDKEIEQSETRAQILETLKQALMDKTLDLTLAIEEEKIWIQQRDDLEMLASANDR